MFRIISESEENKFYVYVYLDPRKPGDYNYGEYHFDYEPFYVGKGEGNRMYEHLFECKLKKNSPKNSKIKKLIKLGFNLKEGFIIKIKENMLENDSLNLEIKMIATIGRLDLNKGPLLNLTDGGDNGTTGYIHSQETKEKNRIGHIGKKASIKTREKMRIANTNPSEKTREKMRSAKVGKVRGPMTNEQKLNVSMGRKGIAAWNKGKTNVYSAERLQENANRKFQ